MSTDFEQRLRSDMAAVVVRPRPGMAREAYRRYHDRRRTTRALAATGTAAVAVAGTAFGVTAASGTTANVPTASSGTPTATIPAQTAAFVAKVSGALGAADALTHATTQYITPDGVALTESYWAYGNRYRETDTVNGKLPSDEEDTAVNGKVTQIVVDYTARTWSRSEFPGGVQNHVDLCSGIWGDGTMANQDAADLKSMIQSGLRCGDLRVAGHQKVDGTDALALTVHFKGASPQTIWVDTKTYLPVEIALHPAGTSFPAPGTGAGDVPVTEELTQYRWLAPTTANLAQLTVPVPPGFQQVSGQG